MKENNLEKLDLSFLPQSLAEQTKIKLKLALTGLNKIKWPTKAVVLGGGYKNRELTYSQDKVGSDIDLFIFSNFVPFFWKKLMRIQKKINKPTHFFHYRGVIPLFLFKSKTFWAYKLKQEGIVLKGDKNILQKIKAKENNIPKIEAIRIVFQTLVVWLMLADLNNRNFRSEANRFTILRSYLNIGESYLTFFGYLKPSYRERMKEFKKRVDEFELEKRIRKKVILGYLTKVDPELAKEKSGEYRLSFSQAKQDCIHVVDRLLLLYLKTNVSLDKKLDILGRQVKSRWLFNLAFFWFLRDINEIKPKFFPILFKFKITDLWKIVIYNEREKRKELFRILKRYFKVQKFSVETLIKIFEAHPSLSTVEII